jgi:hypothetical protein
MSKFLVLTILGLISMPAVGAQTQALSRYRDVTLGESVQTVVERLKVAASDVKVLYEQPSLVQELTWQPHRFVSGSTVVADPLAEIVLTFHLDRLARIVATYDRERTLGLTDADLHELLSGVYGLALLHSKSTQPPVDPIGPKSPRVTISSWADAETLVLLWREEYPRRVGLTITSIAADRALQQELVRGARLEAEGAPQREVDKRAAAATAIKDRDAAIRRENKAKFKP